jgi:hypothetical protein
LHAGERCKFSFGGMKDRMHKCTANLALRMNDVESHLPIDGEEGLVNRHFLSAQTKDAS